MSKSSRSTTKKAVASATKTAAPEVKAPAQKATKDGTAGVAALATAASAPVVTATESAAPALSAPVAPAAAPKPATAQPTAAKPATAPSLTAPTAAQPAAATSPGVPTASARSELNLATHPEVIAFAQQLASAARELVFTTDGWKTVRVVRSAEAPGAFASERVVLEGVAPGTDVEFALHLSAGSAGVWLNNGGRNYRQTSQ